MNITKISWKDHTSDSSWKTIEEIKEWVNNPTICITVGFITHEDDEVVVLSASFDGDESWGENMMIYKHSIISREEL